MNRVPAPEIITVVPWDDELRGIPVVIQDYPQFGFMVPEQMRKVRSPVRVRLDSGGGYHLLGNAGGMLHLDAGGAVAGRTPLPSRTDHVIDYACDASRHCVLLEQAHDAAGRPVNRLRRLDPSGSECWSRTGPMQVGALDFALLQGTFHRLLFNGTDQLYLPGEYHGSEVAEIDLATGAVRRVVPQSAVSSDFASSRAVAAPYDGIAVRPGDRQPFTSHAEAGGVAVTGKDVQIVLAAPPGYPLVHVDAQGRYYLFGGEAPGKPGELRVYSTTGQLESASVLPDNLLTLECRVPPSDSWQVDGAGRIIVPVVTPEGVVIVALRGR
jgi:hypothetical protein